MITINKKGLSKEEVLISRKVHGVNRLTKKKKHSFIKLVVESLGDPIIKILLIALAVKVIFLFNDSNIYETLGIAIAIFLASFISAISEFGSEKAFERLNDENQKTFVKVLRDNIKKNINIEDVVVGDIVYLESGDKIPADGIIIDKEIYVDESLLTGETKEKHKTVIDNNVYMGSIVTNKSGVMQVTLVGDNTYYGKIASLIQDKPLESPLKSRLRVLATTISKIGYIAAFVILLSYMFNTIVVANNFDINKILAFENFWTELIYALTLSVAVVVMAVPEGLPMLITIVLSSNMKRMVKKNVLVRKLVGIETAGSLNILFTDKTGTLTEGKLKVTGFLDANMKKYSSYSAIKNEELKNMLYISLVYNNESFINDGLVVGSNITDRALIDFIGKDDRTFYKKINFEEFDSKKKYSSVTIVLNGKSKKFVKGAYEKIINQCEYYLDENCNKRILIDTNKYINEINEYTSLGYRVISLAIEDDNKKYILLGFMLIKDNIRKYAKEGIDIIKKAGINVVMVTGDSKETAVSVAKSLKIINNSDDIILTSEEFNKLNEEEIKKIIPNLKVLCRSLPEDKNRLVYLSQELDLIVGMTGDGVNDAPALKKADVGFSMGSATEVAKETSDIIILDNNISSIATAILYGRTIFKSIRKFVIFQLSVNLCAVLLNVIGPFIGILTPVTVIQVLWINMVMDTFAGLAFAYEPPLIEYMEEKPKTRKEPILNKYMLNQIVCNGLYASFICIWFLKSKFIFNIYGEEKYLYTAFFGLFIFLAIFNAFNARTCRLNTLSNIFKNKIFIIVIFSISVIQILLVYFGGELFRTTGLTIYEFEIMLLIAFSIIPFDFIRKFILKKRGIKRII